MRFTGAKERHPSRGPRPRIAALIAALLGGPLTLAGAEAATYTARNPHGDAQQCDACHVSVAERPGAVRFEGDVLQLCQSCHDGRQARREAHPVNVAPPAPLAQRWPSGFPLQDGRLTCLTCHDIASGCQIEPPAAPEDLLRGGQLVSRLRFCYHCHAPEDYRAFNVHDQLAGARPKADTCLWCHVTVPDVNAPFDDSVAHALRRPGSGVCRNCHRMAASHPTGGSHVSAEPAPEMLWHMSAYEMQAKMRLPPAQLLKYARAAERAPRSMPLDEHGQITCYTCHNPHEQGLLPLRSPRALGAEPKHATNRRLRARENNVCVACHEK